MHPSVFQHVTGGAVRDRSPEVSDPLTDKRVLIISLAAVHRVQPKSVPSIGVVSCQKFIGTFERRNGIEVIVPAQFAQPSMIALLQKQKEILLRSDRRWSSAEGADDGFFVPSLYGQHDMQRAVNDTIMV